MKRQGYRIQWLSASGVVFMLKGWYDTLEEAEKKCKELQPTHKHHLYVGLCVEG